MQCRKCGQENPEKAIFCSNCGNLLSKPVTIVPGVGAAYSNGWRQLWRNFWELLLTGIIVLALTVPVAIIIGLIFSVAHMFSFSAVTGYFPDTFMWGYTITIYVLEILYFVPIALGIYFVYMTAARGDKVEFGNIFAAFKNYGNVILVAILYIIVIGGISFLLSFISVGVPILGALLNFIWFIIIVFLYCKLAFVPYLLLDRNMKAVDSLKLSWDMTSGHAWKIFLIGLLAIPIGFLGLLCLGIGVIISAMWVNTAFGSLYHAVSTSYQERQTPVPAGPVQPAA
jgi:uncharacterized membrane protein